jgi:glyoxylase-like metal-dependent hydrolase (beta-lactamase superfamily II)
LPKCYSSEDILAFKKMKKFLLTLIFLTFTAFKLVNCQNIASWFTAKEVGNKIWVIGDHGADNMYLVEGNDSSLLIDTGLGAADLASFIKKLTSKPLIVVVTHGHPDHAGSDYQIEKVYIHPADSSAARGFNLPEARAASSKTMQPGNAPADNELFKGKPFNTRMIPVSDGYIFRLGGRTIQVMGTPGHTPGGICLLDNEDKMLFSGDNNNVLVWLFLGNCLPLHTYLKTLEMQRSRMAEFTTLMPGHGEPIPSDFINDQIACVKGILDNSLERKPYKSFAGNAMVSVWGRASVTFNPDNL